MPLPCRLLAVSALRRCQLCTPIQLPPRRLSQGAVGSAVNSPSPEVKSQARKPRRSAPQISEDHMTATKLKEAMESKEILRLALESLRPRIREAFVLVAFTKLSVEEVCTKMRPEKPINSKIIANYVLQALERQDRGFDGEAALFQAIGNERLRDFVRAADPLRWSKQKGFDSYMTNSARVKSFCDRDKKRSKFVDDVREGWCRGEDIEDEKHKIFRGWKKGDAPKLPRSAGELRMRCVQGTSLLSGSSCEPDLKPQFDGRCGNLTTSINLMKRMRMICEMGFTPVPQEQVYSI
ncbi:hypothetical protein FB451DRAFT_1232951 [Mycena latifolia]|nr:hypothetical protein FB451DRAFT_1232951 [Mycena latifolia]